MPLTGPAKILPVAVIGASGFIGRVICARLAQDGVGVIAISRHPPLETRPDITYRRIATLADVDRLAEAMGGADQVIHLADRADRSGYATDGTPPDNMRSVLAAMARADIGRLIFTSSVYARADLRAPKNAYGRLKAEAEEIALRSPADTMVLRLAPVYGPGCRGGFALLVKSVRAGIPLPLAYATARRDYLAIDNLGLIISRLLAHKAKSAQAGNNQIYELADGCPIGTADLARLIGEALGRPARLLPMPLPLLRIAARLSGQTDRLAGAIDALEIKDPLSLPRALGIPALEQMPTTLGYLACDHDAPGRATVTASP